MKLPGYNTLRLLIANKIILVEGPADELIVQRAYIDNYGKMPIEEGVDVMAVGGIAFKRYCELAKLIEKPITVDVDNDGKINNLKDRYEDFEEVAKLCYEKNEGLKTLEPSVLSANKDNFEKFKKIIYRGNDINKIDYKALCTFMINNKTEWAMRVFQSKDKITYPEYIMKAIGVFKCEQ